MLKKLLCLMVVSMLAVGGCGKKAEEKMMEKAIEQDTGDKANVDLSKNKVTIESKDGGKIEIASGGDTSLKVPDDFPKDVFVYPGAKVEASIKTPDGVQLTLVTSDAMAKVTDAYKAKMKAEGWEEKTAAAMGEMTMLQFEKADRTAMVHITKDGENSRIMLMMSQEKESK
ncbi:MAG: hypothetical protein M1457_01470 [bacterium]|nr:hypothetical protein [bacterium]